MNRDAKTQSALIALARTRRMQRALAHAYLHRNAPIPTLRSVARLHDVDRVRDGRSRAAAVTRCRCSASSRAERVAYVVEEIGAGEAPIVYRLWLEGPRAGHLVPIHAWYEQCDDADEIRARLAAVAATLEPVAQSTTEAWMLSTRVVQRRALRDRDRASVTMPIRKFALQLAVEPVSGHGPSGKTHRDRVPAAERLTRRRCGRSRTGTRSPASRITGIPSGVGLTKDTVVLLTDVLR